ncbi:replication protein RepA [Acidisphaera sp. L21]|uniref:replication protein RepA n=1 Tax=Acidisphaera sp. L21 TaxID=1641851 RepID=UPI00131B2D4C|nr:replication protein RepA [Acidisphaera sp. L21]
MPRPPIGQQVHAALVTQGHQAAIDLAVGAGQPDLFERVRAVAHEEPAPSFLHSALCAMSLPVRRPVDDQQPIIRQDGQYTLVITPKATVQMVDGQQALQVLGVPYGSLPRLVLIHIMTEAVRSKSRHVMLGHSFTDWMRRMGFKTISYGPRGSATLIRQQLDRLLACEWMIRWDKEDAQGNTEFAVREIKLANEYTGTDGKGGAFRREIFLTEGFFEHLRKHAVPLNEHAIRQLRDSATALDLYTWLAYRLPRITPGRPATLNWQQLAVHFGNEGTHIRKFRQTVRDAWERHVSAVYPEARADFDTTIIRLHASPAPLQRKLVPGAHLAMVPPSPPAVFVEPDAGTRFFAALSVALGPVDFRAWFRDAKLEAVEPGWQLVVPTAFKADWIRGRYPVALEAGRVAAGLDQVPEIVVRRA